MSGEIDKLLAVLHMPEEEQEEWVESHCELEGWAAPISKDFVPTESLADLAFRLWEPANLRTQLAQGALYVWTYRTHNKYIRNKNTASFEEWWNCFNWLAYATAIDKIIAALIAKELEKK